MVFTLLHGVNVLSKEASCFGTCENHRPRKGQYPRIVVCAFVKCLRLFLCYNPECVVATEIAGLAKPKMFSGPLQKRLLVPDSEPPFF